MALTSFYTAMTGLNNNSLSINLIGDNLANMNTIGFKSSKANFGELLAGLQGTSENGNPITFGLGSSLTGITRTNTQGTVSYSGRSTDAAINGNGFFVVSVNGGQGFTRAGKFEFNSDGGLVSSDGYEILGYMAENGQLNNSGELVPIQIQKGQLLTPTATTSMDIRANLDSSAEDGTVFASTAQIYDSLGTAHAVTLEYTKTSTGNWSWTANIPAEDTTGNTLIGSGDLTFDGQGNLTAPAANPTLTITGLISGGNDATIEFRLLDENGNGLLTSLSSESGVSSTSQDGRAPSILKDISIDASGVIMGLSETGGTVTLAQLALADFPNVEGLQKYKGSTFISFPSSGDPSIGVAGTGGRGSIVGASLEQSNVDMAQEFVDLIVAQRAYQANSSIIKTTDELNQVALSLAQ